jgi:hypothetical protein
MREAGPPDASSPRLLLDQKHRRAGSQTVPTTALTVHSFGLKPRNRLGLLVVRLREIPEGYQPACEGLLCGVRPGRDAQLCIDIGQMALDRAL